MNETETLIEEIKNHMIWLISTIEPVKGVENYQIRTALSNYLQHEYVDNGIIKDFLVVVEYPEIMISIAINMFKFFEFELNWIDVLKSIRTKKLLKIESISNNI